MTAVQQAPQPLEPDALKVTLSVPGPLTVVNGCGVTFGLHVWLTDAAGRRVTPPEVQNYMCAIPPSGGWPPTVIPAGTTKTFIASVLLTGLSGRPLPPGTYVLQGALSVDPGSGVSAAIPATAVTVR